MLTTEHLRLEAPGWGVVLWSDPAPSRVNATDTAGCLGPCPGKLVQGWESTTAWTPSQVCASFQFVDASLQLGAPDRMQDPELAYLMILPGCSLADATQDGMDLPHCKDEWLIDSRSIHPPPAPPALFEPTLLISSAKEIIES